MKHETGCQVGESLFLCNWNFGIKINGMWDTQSHIMGLAAMDVDTLKSANDQYAKKKYFL